MAKSKSHELGELIGKFIEEVMKEPLREFAQRSHLYFDSYGLRNARSGPKITWKDKYSCSHDLDYVLERGGSENQIGTPVAFIEVAWRSYTKHSKNKVQEIYGAVNPISEKFHLINPFKGAILSGKFTVPSLKQLEAQGFDILYIPFEKVVEIFKKNDLDIYFDENTPETHIETIIENWRHLSELDFEKIKESLYIECELEIKNFIKSLEKSVSREIAHIYVLPLYGNGADIGDVESAIKFIVDSPDFVDRVTNLQHIHISVFYKNGSHIESDFKSKSEAIDFLNRIVQ